mgnify:CR=1 FL=1
MDTQYSSAHDVTVNTDSRMNPVTIKGKPIRWGGNDGQIHGVIKQLNSCCLLYTSPSPRDP